MLQKMSESEGKVIGYKAGKDITKEDFETLGTDMGALIEREGSVCLMLDLEEFHWESPSVWGTDLKFGKAHHDKIDKMAVVGDKKWQHLMTNISAPFYTRDAKWFHTADRAAAWDWLRGK
jgi:hypothetical protein